MTFQSSIKMPPFAQVYAKEGGRMREEKESCKHQRDLDKGGGLFAVLNSRCSFPLRGSWLVLCSLVSKTGRLKWQCEHKNETEEVCGEDFRYRHSWANPFDLSCHADLRSYNTSSVSSNSLYINF